VSNNHRSMREISNQYLPNKQNFQTKWVDFPNHLHPKEEVAFESEQEEMKEEAIVEHYLPFSHPTPSALEEKMNPEKKEGILQSFKESSQRGNNRDKWRSFLQEKPTRTRFTPSTVPSILKGMTPSISVKKQVAYEELENRLKREPEELLIFSSEETPLVTVEEVENLTVDEAVDYFCIRVQRKVGGDLDVIKQEIRKFLSAKAVDGKLENHTTDIIAWISWSV